MNVDGRRSRAAGAPSRTVKNVRRKSLDEMMMMVHVIQGYYRLPEPQVKYRPTISSVGAWPLGIYIDVQAT